MGRGGNTAAIFVFERVQYKLFVTQVDLPRWPCQSIEMTGSSSDRFKQAVITTLAKRAAFRCSNPDCAAITSGPSATAGLAVNVGEAAHIYGAHPGSARYDPKMQSVARADIANAIWLCGNCHKLIDDDEARFPSGLLFEWVREHERDVALIVGKAGAKVRQRYEERHLEEFGRLSYRAERIIIDKEALWEYNLTEEVLRFEIAPVLQRWGALRRGLYIKSAKRLAKLDFVPWIMNRLAEIRQIVHAFAELMNVEFLRAWGEPGVAGNERDIVDTARLFVEVCSSALAWEEEVRFATVDEIFRDVLALYVGVAGNIIDEAAKLPEFLAATFGGEKPSGDYRFTLVLSLPEGWSEAVEDAFERATEAYITELNS
jgi:flavin-binding protein dodecin